MPIDRSSLSPAQVAMLDQYEASQKQVATLEQVATTLEKMAGSLDSQTSDETAKNLLADVKDLLHTLVSKDDPETPDYATPVVKALSSLQKELSSSIKAIDVKPNVAAPNVKVDAPKLDLRGVERVLKTDIPQAFEKAIKLIPTPPAADNSEVVDRLEAVLEKLQSIDTATRLKPTFPNTMKVTNADGSVIAAPTGTEATADNQVTLQNMVDELASLVNGLKFLSAMQTTASELRMSITSGTLPTVTTVTTLTGQTNIGGYGAQHTIMTQMNTNVATAIRSNISVT